MNTLISSEIRLRLSETDRIDLGPFYAKKLQRNFIIGCDARPLLALFDAAAMGSRVYEFMTIKRPGDLFWYLHLTMIDVDTLVREHLTSRMKMNTAGGPPQIENDISFVDFDSYFYELSDESEDFERKWLSHRQSTFWHNKLEDLLLISQSAQQKLRAQDDFLLQHEIQLIDVGRHRRDFIPVIERHALLQNRPYKTSALPVELMSTIATLIKQKDICSVSCPFADYQIWRLLVEEQIRRVQQTGLPPREAFFLCGPDGYQMNLSGADMRHYPNEPEDWGGDVHIPFEGTLGADLFIKPDWHGFKTEYAGTGGSLSDALFGKPCRYLLTKQDFGELGCASRLQVGNWILYRCDTHSA